ncbi:hypothetical protein CJF32_00007749 [Rutstroemia sp. NJR-2017a WRK4]|nr:hypothetical protein CJF32_00007749 [Rutstroemia sp. NJR-2017a WRK4]
MYPNVNSIALPTAFVWLILSLLEGVNAGAVFIFTGGKITRLSYTHLIPSPPTALQGQGPNWKIQATWAGLQPDDQSCVLQNVVGNAGNEVGHWHHIPSFYDGATKPSYTELYFEDTQPEVYPGDEITSTWTLDTRTNKWLDTWSVMPGPTGSKKGEVPYGGNYTFDGSKFNPKVPDMTEVLLMIEHLALPAATASFPDPGWHSGPVTFTNIIIESTETASDWCNAANPQAWLEQGVKVLDKSTPFSWTIRDGKKSCHIGWVTIQEA